MKHDIQLTVNGDTFSLAIDPWRNLNQVLREDLNLTGTKLGCGSGDCGACTVILDGRSVSSCLTLAVEADGKEILTVEGLAPSGEELHPIQEAFIEKGAIQCGFCTPGFVVSFAGYLLEAGTWRIDDAIEARLSYAVHARLGYLTACPTNVGTGLRASVLMHLPGLVLTRRVTQLMQAADMARDAQGLDAAERDELIGVAGAIKFAEFMKRKAEKARRSAR